jgi:hypothetical protein
MVTTLRAVWVGWWRLADTVIRVPSLAVGAVKVPSLAIAPFDAAQVTAVLLVPLTVAVNRCCAPGARVTVLGEM